MNNFIMLSSWIFLAVIFLFWIVVSKLVVFIHRKQANQYLLKNPQAAVILLDGSSYNSSFISNRILSIDGERACSFLEHKTSPSNLRIRAVYVKPGKRTLKLSADWVVYTNSIKWKSYKAPTVTMNLEIVPNATYILTYVISEKTYICERQLT